MMQGAYTAIVTPFTPSGDIDWARLKANVEFQIKGGIDGLVPVGTTGESPTLSHDEHRKVIEEVIKAVAGRVPVIAGTGSNCTSEAVDLTRHAKQVGANGALVVNPYYNKPTQEGLYRHFSTVADVGLPVVVYNIPGRTGVEVSMATMQRLAPHPMIQAVKEATGSLDNASELARTTQLDVVSGDDSLTLPIMAVGGKGVISVVSNLVPARVKALTAAALQSDFVAARKVHQELFPLFKGAFVETNPIPIKTAMMLCGMDSGTLRLPMCPLADNNLPRLQQLLRDLGLLK